MIQLSHANCELKGSIQISGSKSESNRWLILQKIYPDSLTIRNLSCSEDTNLLQKALQQAIPNNKTQTIDIGHAGTAMRFLTAYFSVNEGYSVVLTGFERMQQRPIAPLVEALQQLGCSIEYLKKIGFPPLKISGHQVEKEEVTVRADISSQYITALMLIAPQLPKGLIINLIGDLTSQPYVEMTQKQLQCIGIEVDWRENNLKIQPENKIQPQQITVESDWSSASYWFSAVALSDSAEIVLSDFNADSWQGDAIVKDIFQKYFGVTSEFNFSHLTLKKIPNFTFPQHLELDLNNCPDLAQTIAVTCAGLRIKSKITGLQTLKIKETDRLLALQSELLKIGVQSYITEDSIELISFDQPKNIPVIQTYQDHRMAMSFAPLALKFPIMIEDEMVVKKSYPNFWQDFAACGFLISH